MPAIRLLDTDGKTIGTVILDEPLTEQEIVNTVPDLRLTYSASLTDIHSFTLEIVPTDSIADGWAGPSTASQPRDTIG